jgi:hypothetical protein
VVRLLLAAKADILSKDGDGLTPKELAKRNSRDQVVAIMDDFEKHRSTLVWVSQKSAWLGMANARLRADGPAAGLVEKHWLAVVAKISQAHTQRPSMEVVCRFHWRGTLALQQGFAWRTSQLQPRPAPKVEPEEMEVDEEKEVKQEEGADDKEDKEDKAKEEPVDAAKSSPIKEEGAKKGGGRKRKDKDDAEPAKRSRR